jgi:hypothetical protein
MKLYRPAVCHSRVITPLSPRRQVMWRVVHHFTRARCTQTVVEARVGTVLQIYFGIDLSATITQLSIHTPDSLY